MLLVLDFDKIARDLQQPPLVPRNRIWLLADTFVELGDRRVQRARDLVQLRGRDAIDTLLGFLGLLIGYTENFSEFVLSHAKHDAAFADARRHEFVDRCTLPGLRRHRDGCMRQSQSVARACFRCEAPEGRAGGGQLGKENPSAA